MTKTRNNLTSGCQNTEFTSKVNKLGELLQWSLYPWFITGFSDGEATFTLSITKDNRIRKSARRGFFLVATLPKKMDQNNGREIFSVHPSFAIALNIKDENIIHRLQSYFGVGKIKRDNSHNAIVFYVWGWVPHPPPLLKS